MRTRTLFLAAIVTAAAALSACMGGETSDDEIADTLEGFFEDVMAGDAVSALTYISGSCPEESREAFTADVALAPQVFAPLGQEPDVDVRSVEIESTDSKHVTVIEIDAVVLVEGRPIANEFLEDADDIPFELVFEDNVWRIDNCDDYWLTVDSYLGRLQELGDEVRERRADIHEQLELELENVSLDDNEAWFKVGRDSLIEERKLLRRLLDEVDALDPPNEYKSAHDDALDSWRALEEILSAGIERDDLAIRSGESPVDKDYLEDLILLDVLTTEAEDKGSCHDLVTIAGQSGTNLELPFCGDTAPSP